MANRSEKKTGRCRYGLEGSIRVGQGERQTCVSRALEKRTVPKFWRKRQLRAETCPGRGEKGPKLTWRASVGKDVGRRDRSLVAKGTASLSKRGDRVRDVSGNRGGGLRVCFVAAKGWRELARDKSGRGRKSLLLQKKRKAGQTFAIGLELRWKRQGKEGGETYPLKGKAERFPLLSVRKRQELDWSA